MGLLPALAPTSLTVGCCAGRQSGHDKNAQLPDTLQASKILLLAYLPAFSLPTRHRVEARGALAQSGVDPDPGRASCLPPPGFRRACVAREEPARAARPGLTSKGGAREAPCRCPRR